MISQIELASKSSMAIKERTSLPGKHFFLLLLVFFIMTSMVWVYMWYASTYFFNSKQTKEIRLDFVKMRFGAEGLGSMLSTLKSVLLLSNWTGATITGNPVVSGHGYSTSKYFNMAKPLKRGRIICNIPQRDISNLLKSIIGNCTKFPVSSLSFLFRNCNTLIVSSVPVHPRNCLKATAPLVRNFVKFNLTQKHNVPKSDLCVLRRGGDVETKIRRGDGNVWAIDESRTILLIEQLKKKAVRIVLSTETNFADEIRKKYKVDLFSNREPLHRVVKVLSACRCLFVSAGSSFGVTIAQIVDPAYIVYAVNAQNFSFNIAPYNYAQEFGNRSISVRAPTDEIVEKCSS